MLKLPCFIVALGSCFSFSAYSQEAVGSSPQECRSAILKMVSKGAHIKTSDEYSYELRDTKNAIDVDILCRPERVVVFLGWLTNFPPAAFVDAAVSASSFFVKSSPVELRKVIEACRQSGKKDEMLVQLPGAQVRCQGGSSFTIGIVKMRN